MSNLTLIRHALANAADRKTLNDLFAQFDAETANLWMLEASGSFGFKVAEAEGTIYTTAYELGKVMGVGDRAIRDLCHRHGIPGVPLGGFARSEDKLPSLIKQQLSLKDNDNTTVLFGYDAFLLCGMQGRTERAKAVRTYLLQMEKYARIDLHSRAVTGRGIIEHVEETTGERPAFTDVVSRTDDAIFLAKDRYIELLEIENKMLRKWSPYKGKRQGRVTDEIILKVYEMRAQGHTYKQIAAATKLSGATISYICMKRPLIPVK